MRGYRNLFTDFEEKSAGSVDEETRVKGRNPANHARRNDCLVDRYFWYKQKPEKLDYDQIVAKVANEFFLSKITVAEAVQDNIEQLRTLHAKKPPVNYFATKWPDRVWKH